MTEPASFRTLDDWLPWLETLSPREIVLGLERVEEVLARLNIRRPPVVVTVAGTNGKGSSAAMIEALLCAAGMRTGCYTSPHLVRYNERIRIDRVPAADEVIVSAFRTVESARQDVPLTFFEFGTLAALVAFAALDVQAWILEVGMGGRLDAVNAVEPDASLITNVSLDHCAWLGNDVEAIGREKAGIMRRGVVTVFGSTAVPASVVDVAEQTGAILCLAGRDFAFEAGPEDRRWSWRGQRLALDGLRPPALSGPIQLQNAAAALAVVEALGLDRVLTSDRVDAALSGLQLPGRFQEVVAGCHWILDVGHNPAAGKVLAGRLAGRRTHGRLIAVVGMLGDKDAAGFIEPLCPYVDRWIAVTINGTRRGDAATLAQQVAALCAKPCRIVERLQEGLQAAADAAAPDDTILVTGSFFLVGPALDWLAARSR